MDADAVFQLEALKTGGVVVADIEVLARGDGRLLDETVLHRVRQGIAVDHIAEDIRPAAALHLRAWPSVPGPRQGLSSLMALMPAEGPVAVRFVHDDNQVVQACEIVEVALADVLLEAAESRHVGPGRPAVVSVLVILLMLKMLMWTAVSKRSLPRTPRPSS